MKVTETRMAPDHRSFQVLEATEEEIAHLFALGEEANEWIAGHADIVYTRVVDHPDDHTWLVPELPAEAIPSPDGPTVDTTTPEEQP